MLSLQIPCYKKIPVCKYSSRATKHLKNLFGFFRLKKNAQDVTHSENILKLNHFNLQGGSAILYSFSRLKLKALIVNLIS